MNFKISNKARLLNIISKLFGQIENCLELLSLKSSDKFIWEFLFIEKVDDREIKCVLLKYFKKGYKSDLE